MKSAEARRSVAAGIVLACLAAYAGTLGTKGFLRDDRAFMAENPLIHGGLGTLPQLLSTGYLEATMGDAAPSHFYRPLTVLTFSLQFMTTGAREWPLHAVNVLLHALVCLLLWAALRRRMTETAAAAAALVFAVMPIHAEVVSYITSRADLLAMAFMLGAWLVLDEDARPGRIAAASALYGAALLSKEPAILFPAFLALSDWTFRGKAPWHPERRRAYAALLAAAAVYLCLRRAVLDEPMNGGFSYFEGKSRLVAALTYSRFVLEHYLLPSATGIGLCADYGRPLIPDSAPSSPAAWVPALGLSGLFLSAAFAVRSRRPWGFWVLAPALFLLPGCHLLVPLDTLGAERYFYITSVSVAVGLGSLFAWVEARRKIPARLALAALLLWYAAAATARNKVWQSELAGARDMVRCNPVSAKARSGLSSILLVRGETAEGKAHALEALRLDPAQPWPYYNLANEAWRRRDLPEAERLVRKAVALQPGSASPWVLLALVAEAQGRLEEESRALEKAVAIMPWHPIAQYNLGRLRLLQGRPRESLPHFRLFLRYAPADPDAGSIARLVAGIESAGPETHAGR